MSSLSLALDPNPIPQKTTTPEITGASQPDHDQASTGMTTGSWLVSFGLEGQGWDDALEAVEEELREAYVIPAMVKAMGQWLMVRWMKCVERENG